ncbi:MAG: hypothetical protein F4Z01_05750 [Gammaproteobacteria bacterium]|nr:hypothetical protein [Gammaproteobacteria bacterium]MYF37796.1 hypothetical protein [Gammaproteobacteria bacterium]
MDSMYMWGGIVLIVFLSVASSLISQWIRARYRARKSDVDARLSALEAQTDLDQLEERVRVLESIVTDPQGNLRTKIDSL